MVAATEDVAEVIMADTLTATVMAITVTLEDMDMVGEVILTGVVGAVILTGGAGGVILTGGVTPTGGIILTIPTPTPITIPIPVPITMEDCRCLHKGLPLRHNRGNSNHLTGTSARTQRVTTPTLKIVRVVG